MSTGNASYALLAGQSVDFDHDAVERGIGDDARGVWVDEIVARFGRLGITPRAAGAIWDYTQANSAADASMREGLDEFTAIIRAMLDSICVAKRPRMEAECHRLALGIRRSNTDSMRGVAIRAGVTVEAVSKRVQALQEFHGLSGNSFNKSAAAVHAYRETNRRRR